MYKSLVLLVSLVLLHLARWCVCLQTLLIMLQAWSVKLQVALTFAALLAEPAHLDMSTLSCQSERAVLGVSVLAVSVLGVFVLGVSTSLLP